MYLSNLVYRCAKAAADYGDPSFSYENYLIGKAQEDEDYSAFIDKSLSVVNEFIQRCYELNKLPAKVAELGEPDEDGYLALPEDFGKAISLFQLSDSHNQYQVVAYRKIGKKIAPLKPFSPYKPFQLQYRAKVPYFDESFIPHVIPEEDGTFYYDGNSYDSMNDAIAAIRAYSDSYQGNFDVPHDVELEDEIGFSDTLATICVAFVQGRLMDDRSEGHSREVEAESRLADVTLDETLFLQKQIVRSYK